jgi:hypothetical protein
MTRTASVVARNKVNAALWESEIKPEFQPLSIRNALRTQCERPEPARSVKVENMVGR